jgi:hypothetical protein
MANSKMLRKLANSCIGEHLRDVRAQFARFTVRISQAGGSKVVEERHAGQPRILECAIAAWSEAVARATSMAREGQML